MAIISVTHFSDPGCPWAYSASPALAVLRWRYGDQLAWRHVMIGLTEDGDAVRPARLHAGSRWPRATGASATAACRSADRPARAAARHLAGLPRDRRHAAAGRPSASGRCSARCSSRSSRRRCSLERDEDLRAALATSPGLDADAVLAALDDADVERGLRGRPRRGAHRRRLADGVPGQGREHRRRACATPRRRSSSPTDDGRRLEAGGFQPLEAYDVCVANLDPTLERRARRRRTRRGARPRSRTG